MKIANSAGLAACSLRVSRRKTQTQEGSVALATLNSSESTIEAWGHLADWQKFSSRLDNFGTTQEAVDFRQLRTRTLAEFGCCH
jgi:hypothetical protein